MNCQFFSDFETAIISAAETEFRESTYDLLFSV